MAEHPILFTSERVRAILDGRKTQTRRIIKPQHVYCQSHETIEQTIDDMRYNQEGLMRCCPYGTIGDTLWVRESFAIFDVDGDEDIAIGYKADDTYKSVEWFKDKRKEFKELRLGKWRPSIHLHRWAARIFFEITNIRVERVQDVTLADIKEEGLSIDRKFQETKDAWINLWDSINAKRGYGWDKNPWVWVIEFKNQLLIKETLE